jgi:hypothetical protein
MILTPGQLYFINEQDTQTGVRSNYYKIGIVRDADDRDSENRLLEHQTGNPRKLCIVEKLSMPAVEAVETNLHYLFASKRVMGEWMNFTDEELQKAINKAKELAAGMQANIKDFKRAEELKNIQSNGKITLASDEAKELYTDVMNFKIVLNSCDEVLDLYKEYLYAAIEKGDDVEGKAYVQAKSGAKKFDEKVFLKNYPDLYGKYAISSNPVKGSFRLKLDKDWEFDISTIESDQVKLISDFKEQLDSADHSLEMGFSLHDKHLGVLEIKKFAEWESDIANTKLKVITDNSEGIEGICTWKRESKEVISLDKKKLQTEHPVEYNSCVVQGADTEALIVKPKIAEVT